MLKLIPPRPIPASTTASMTANAVAVDVTYKRKKRSQMTSNARRIAPAVMLTKSRFHGAFANAPWNLLFVSMTAGAILLALEVIWLRFLRLYVTSTATAFAVMLAVVLAGIGLGGISFSMIPRRLASPRPVVPVLLLLAAIGTLLSYVFFPVPVLPPNKPALTSGFFRQIGH